MGRATAGVGGQRPSSRSLPHSSPSTYQGALHTAPRCAPNPGPLYSPLIYLPPSPWPARPFRPGPFVSQPRRCDGVKQDLGGSAL
eukprot:8692276-Alexandrium_andersonii.AAC.1